MIKIDGKWRHTEESKRKMSESRKGRIISEEWRKNMSLAKQKQKERDGYINSPEARKKLSETLKGRKKTEQHRKNLSGANSSFWRGGVSKDDKKLRERARYKEWRTAVFERDDYTCKHCGQRGGQLNADHKIPFALLPEEPNKNVYDGYFYRYNIDIGQTLCVTCHKKTPTYGIGTVKIRDILEKVY